MGRVEAARTLGALLQELGWVEQEDEEIGDPAEVKKMSEIPMGVTMVSHSKYVVTKLLFWSLRLILV